MATTTRTTSKLNGKTSSADIESSIEQVKADIAQLTKTLADYGQGQVSTASATAKAKSNDMIAQSELVIGDLQRQVEELTAQASGKVREKPIQSILFAAGIGAALAFLSKRS